jgi:hypothetical protein
MAAPCSAPWTVPCACAATGSAIVANTIIAHSFPDLIDRPSVEYFELILGNLPRPSSFLLMKF